ncbi:MAG: hypothetical protein MZV64_63610 [Ignavibacteriales bacterium]|nr:hypothetical protein [Ignavibacteriales bacterium]
MTAVSGGAAPLPHGNRLRRRRFRPGVRGAGGTPRAGPHPRCSSRPRRNGLRAPAAARPRTGRRPSDRGRGPPSRCAA